MKALAPNQLSMVDAMLAMESGVLTPETLVQACLERIVARNPEVLAFTAFDADQVLREARSLGAAGSQPLRGLPFAAKDVIDTVDYDTSYGSPIYQGHRPHLDASCVALARERGAVLMGKVATCEFATQTPCETRNPLSLDRTPGGSSSGSAAAVADYMVPVAFGTQTTGSTVRPAVYCGIVGYKPSFGFINNAGLKPLSPSQDTLTLFTRDVRDAAYFMFGLHGAKHVQKADSSPRIGICLSSQWAYARKETTDAIDRLTKRLTQDGAVIRQVQLPVELEEMIEVQGRISAYEARHSLANERLHHHTSLSPRLQARLDQESATSPEEYFAMKRQAKRARQLAHELFSDVDVLLYPASEGEAEVGLANTGSPRYGALWTILHLPCVSFPIGTGPAGMPLGAQLIGAYGDDVRVLAATQFVSGQVEYVRTSVS